MLALQGWGGSFVEHPPPLTLRLQTSGQEEGSPDGGRRLASGKQEKCERCTLQAGWQKPHSNALRLSDATVCWTVGRHLFDLNCVQSRFIGQTAPKF